MLPEINGRGEREHKLLRKALEWADTAIVVSETTVVSVNIGLQCRLLEVTVLVMVSKHGLNAALGHSNDNEKDIRWLHLRQWVCRELEFYSLIKGERPGKETYLSIQFNVSSTCFCQISHSYSLSTP